MSKNHHDCKQVISKVMLVLDGALTTEDEKQFLTDLNCCASCLEKYEIEKSFKTFLTNKIRRREVSTSLILNIRSQLSKFRPGDSARP